MEPISQRKKEEDKKDKLTNEEASQPKKKTEINETPKNEEALDFDFKISPEQFFIKTEDNIDVFDKFID